MLGEGKIRAVCPKLGESRDLCRPSQRVDRSRTAYSLRAWSLYYGEMVWVGDELNAVPPQAPTSAESGEKLMSGVRSQPPPERPEPLSGTIPDEFEILIQRKEPQKGRISKGF